MAAQALAFGALSATGKVFLSDSKGWAQDFKTDSTEAADSVTPVGAYLLKSAFVDTPKVDCH
eukprot:CAMPEP_0173077324 /NCGR_PEP_ID=MMETSP1102-20130122/13140_1 /TAXON_ID=49646 /ORGANISM="Geminigera sp., Strain Caron Lab Isolate" /LENGTH=61 /DNA_ID=CAMNT_0013947753 /DNA_START=326 /DNA_END=511 /DNA_ORIENTATION=+